MAAPFVTGAAALLMEWGIVRGNDLYMYGDKLKASLIKGAGENVFTTASRAVSENTSKNTKYPNLLRAGVHCAYWIVFLSGSAIRIHASDASLHLPYFFFFNGCFGFLSIIIASFRSF